MSWHYKLTAFASAAAVGSFLTMGTIPASAEEIVLKMAVPDWPPTHIMKDLFDKNYKAPSGNDVKLDVDFIPWPDYYTRLNTSLTSGENKYNMAVSDSQWLGAFIEAGYYRKINDLIDADPGLKATLADMHPNPLQAYATYPYKSENYYGFPQMPDILISYYRTDIVCNEDGSVDVHFVLLFWGDVPPPDLTATTNQGAIPSEALNAHSAMTQRCTNPSRCTGSLASSTSSQSLLSTQPTTGLSA